MSPLPTGVTTDTKAPTLVSKSRLAIAHVILQSKPPDLSVSEYFTQLRRCIHLAGRSPAAPADLRHISSVEFWRNRCFEKDSKVTDLEAQAHKLVVENKQLQADAKRCQDEYEDLQQGGPRKKRKKPAIVSMPIAGAVPAIIQSWEVELAVYHPLSAASEDLLPQLQSLALATTSKHISNALKDVCTTLATTLDELCGGQSNQRVSDTATAVKADTGGRGQLMDSAWIKNITLAIDQVLRHIKTSLTKFHAIIDRKNPKRTDVTQQEMFANQAAISGQLFKLIVSIIDSLHMNSIALLKKLEARPEYAQRAVRDIRSSITELLVSFLTNLNAESKMERNILEGAVYAILEAAGKCLYIPKPPAKYFQDNLDEKTTKDKKGYELQKLALGGTSYQVLQLLKRVLPVYRGHLEYAFIHEEAEEGRLGVAAKTRFREAILCGVFGPMARADEAGAGDEIWKGTIGKGMRWTSMHAKYDFEVVENQFAVEVWALLGLESLQFSW